MNNKLSIAHIIFITAPIFFSCSGPAKDEIKKNTPASSISLHAGDEKYIDIDAKESVVMWKGSNSFGTHAGYVYISKGKLMIKNNQLTGGTVEVDMNSLEDDAHDKNNGLIMHLKDPDFFDVKKFPFASIVITKVAIINIEDKQITGNLTIKGITHPVSFPAKMGMVDGVLKATGKLVIDRTKWGVRYGSGKFFDNLKDKAISDNIEFDIKIVARTAKKDQTKEKPSESNAKAAGQPKLIKTIGNPRSGNVQCSLQDKTGNLWFGTTENGLYKYDGKSFTRFLVADGLSSNNVYSLLEDKEGKIWIGTEAGPCLYDGKLFTRLQIPLPQNLPPNNNPNYRNSRWVYDIMQAKSGKLWFVTIDGIFIYDGKSFTPFMVDDANGFLTSNDKAERIFEDKAGTIWFGGRTNQGVYRYDGKSVTNLKLKELVQDGPRPKPVNWCWPQLQDKNGNIWFSNWGGAYRYDGKSFTSFTKEDGLPGGVTSIIEDKKGNLWFGGDASAGLSRYDGKSFTHFTTKNGLVNNSIWSILEDKAGNIWVGTRETGLCLFDGTRFITYSEYKN